jgi:predicted TIM-barrel fold metal-dependent hydrolase
VRPIAWCGRPIGHTRCAIPARPNDALLLDMLLDWVPDEATRAHILVDNPARLYGFK